MKPASALSTGGGSAKDLCAFTSAASFWMPRLLLRESAWIEHSPFSFWLIDVLRPKTIVELGCYSGFSYYVFCQAVQDLNLDSRCYGIDNWRGDEHAGFYDEAIFKRVSEYNSSHYNAFSRLIRSDFDEALPHFGAGSIDLLHIDGAHFYDAVKSDYVNWRSRLSKSGVILFHDTNVRERGFGVERLWSELIEDGNHFEFVHGNGLGILGVGSDLPRQLKDLFACKSNPDVVAQIRLAYSRLGLGIADRIEREALGNEARTEVPKAPAEMSLVEPAVRARVSKLEIQLGRQSRRHAYLSALASQREAELERRDAELERRDAELQRIEAEYNTLANLELRHAADLEALRHDRDHVIQTLQQVYKSRSWRISAPYRAFGRLFRGDK